MYWKEYGSSIFRVCIWIYLHCICYSSHSVIDSSLQSFSSWIHTVSISESWDKDRMAHILALKLDLKHASRYEPSDFHPMVIMCWLYESGFLCDLLHQYSLFLELTALCYYLELTTMSMCVLEFLDKPWYDLSLQLKVKKP